MHLNVAGEVAKLLPGCKIVAQNLETLVVFVGNMDQEALEFKTKNPTMAEPTLIMDHIDWSQETWWNR